MIRSAGIHMKRVSTKARRCFRAVLMVVFNRQKACPKACRLGGGLFQKIQCNKKHPQRDKKANTKKTLGKEKKKGRGARACVKGQGNNSSSHLGRKQAPGELKNRKRKKGGVATLKKKTIFGDRLW